MIIEPDHIQARRKALSFLLDEQNPDYYKAVLTLTPRDQWHSIKEEEAKSRYAIMFYTHLAKGDYEEAVSMVLPKHRFNLDAKTARRVWNLCFEETQMLIMGAGAVGKTFTIGVWTLLDFLRDPENTLINVVSVTKKHARGNLFGDMVKTWEQINKIVPLVGECSGEKIAVTSSGDTCGIFLVGIAEGDQGIGRLRGLHPKPRTKAHPIFGNLTRTRTILDEASQIPRGIWSDLRNAFITQDGKNTEQIKILGASNPEDPNSEYGQRCEPIGGWINHDDELEEWESHRGWKIYRIDAAKTENVIQRKMVCEGMQTYEGFLNAMKDAGGEGSPGYWVMCRGMFPPQGHGQAIISNALLQRAKGEWIFEDTPTEVYSLDPALEGGDRPILTYARFGMAKRARVRIKSTDEHGSEFEDTEEIEIHPVARQCIQVDFQVPLEGGDSIKVAENFRDHVPDNIDPYWVAVDGTGTGDGVKSAIRRFIGEEVMSIIYSEKPTEMKVMTDDDRPASQLYRNIRAELYYSTRKWLESRLIMFAEGCDVELYRQLSNIRGGLAGSKYAVEKKDRYKARNRGRSPDNAESMIQITHIVRLRGDVEAGVFEDANEEPDYRDATHDPMTSMTQVSAFDD